VASEVRNLAQRSAAAAKEIKGLIDDSVEKVGTGSKLVEQAGTTMSDIVDSVQRVTQIVGEIAAASEEQSGGISQVNQAVSQMDETTQQNAALVEEAAAAAAALQQQAETLAQVVSVFKLDSTRIGHSSAIAPSQRATIDITPSGGRIGNQPPVKRKQLEHEMEEF
jgi:methyl-accepting chemotaxis protein